MSLERTRSLIPPENCNYRSTCSLDTCPVLDQLDRNDRGGLSPRLTAESVCISSLASAIPSSHAKNQLVSDNTKANYLLDKAMARSVHDTELAWAEFGEYLRIVNRILSTPQQEQIEHIAAKRGAFLAQIQALSALEPALRERINSKEVNSQVSIETHRNLCEMLRGFRARYHEGENNGVQTEALVAEYTTLAIINRPTILYDTDSVPGFAFVAVHREESSHSQPDLNHDLYYAYDRYTKKVPIQVKHRNDTRSRRYDSSVLLVYYNKLKQEIESAYNKLLTQHSLCDNPTVVERVDPLTLLLLEHDLSNGRALAGEEPVQLHVATCALDSGKTYLKELIRQRMNTAA